MAKNRFKAVFSANKWTGLVAFTLFVSTLFLLLYGFSAYITRSQIDRSTAASDFNQQSGESITSNTTTNLDKIIHNIEKFNEIEKNISNSSTTLSDLDFEISSKTAERTEEHTDIIHLNIETGDRMSATLLEIQAQLNQTEYRLTAKELQELSLERNRENSDGRLPFTKTRHYLSVLKSQLNQSPESTPQLLEVAEIIKEANAYIKAYDEKHFGHRDIINTKTKEIKKAAIYQSREKEKLSKLNAVRDKVVQDLPKDSDAIFSSLNLLGGTLLFFIKLPTIVLTLIVTIAAGGLASLVSFTRKFLHNNDNHVGVGTLLSNVAEGIAASIGIFLFAGTGMLMLTQGSATAATSVELSPYMVAFLAFLSGFMAESAFMRIEAAGRDFFKTEDHPDDTGHSGAAEKPEAKTPAPQ